MINPKLSRDWCHTSQKRNKKTDVFPQTLAGEDDSRLKSRERSGWTRLGRFLYVLELEANLLQHDFRQSLYSYRYRVPTSSRTRRAKTIWYRAISFETIRPTPRTTY